MIRRFAPAATAAALSLSAISAHAQDAAGVWHGALATPAGSLRLLVRLQEGASGLSGALLSPDQSPEPIPIAHAAAKDGALAFEIPSIQARFSGRWDAARSAWVGQWEQGASLPLALEKGDLPKGAVVAGLDGDWKGVLQLQTGDELHLVLHVRTGPYGTAATLDSVDQGAAGIPAPGLTREGGKVRFDVPAGDAAFAGALSADGRTLSGDWSQGGRSLPLTLSR